MSAPQWPESLPQQIQQDGFSAGPRDNVVRTQMSTGEIKTRRRSTVARDEMTFEVPLTREQYAIFRAFWRDTIGYGSLPFAWTDPRTDEPAHFQPIEPYREHADGPYIVVTMHVEVRDAD